MCDPGSLSGKDMGFLFSFQCKRTYCKLEKECSDAKEKFDEAETRSGSGCGFVCCVW